MALVGFLCLFVVNIFQIHYLNIYLYFKSLASHVCTGRQAGWLVFKK